MAITSIWAGVTIAQQSVIGTAVAVTGVTKANPGVATATAHGFANGDYVVFTGVQGTPELNNRVVRVSGSTANTFNLEGIDTTLLNTFVSGNAQKLTFGTTFSSFTGVNASGGDFDFIDITTIDTLQKSQIPGVANPLKIELTSIWDVSDTALLAAKTASDAKAQRAFLVTFANGQKFAFYGYIGASLSPTGNALDKVTTSLAITSLGKSTTYAT